MQKLLLTTFLTTLLLCVTSFAQDQLKSTPVVESSRAIKLQRYQALPPQYGGPMLYRAALTQSGLSAPIADTLENNLGVDIIWERVMKGVYRGTPVGGIWPEGRIAVRISSGNQTAKLHAAYVENGEIWVETRCFAMVFQEGTPTVTYEDGGLNDSLIDVFVYPTLAV